MKLTFSGSLYRGRKSTNNGGTPLCNAFCIYFPTKVLKSSPTKIIIINAIR